MVLFQKERAEKFLKKSSADAKEPKFLKKPSADVKVKIGAVKNGKKAVKSGQ